MVFLGTAGLLASAQDSRQVWHGEPDWLGAVGQLQVPSRRYQDQQTKFFTEDCSATLVARPGRTSTAIVVSAWHCLEHYRDLSRDIQFSLAGPGAALGALTARPMVSGGNMDADWAILQLERPVPASVQVPLIAWLPGEETTQLVTMAGYSRDIVDPHGTGRLLTFDDACAVSVRTRSSVSTNCRAKKGASGGAVVQQSAAGEPRLVGVISAGDGEGVSHYVPVTRFRTQLELALQ